jgi:hypothetical protein
MDTHKPRKTNIAKIYKLPAAGAAVIESYVMLKLANRHVVAPYFMNEPGRKGRRVSVGKGTARALERETIRLAKRHRLELQSATSDQIRQFMIDHKLGIDCSGLVAWILYEILREKNGQSLWRTIKFSGSLPRRKLARHLRPVENISARLLTGPRNAVVIRDLRDVRPGDLIRSLNGNHVILITEVGFDDHNVPVYLRYVNSTEWSGVKYGVRFGLIDIIAPHKNILAQTWIDGEDGVNWLFDAASNFPDDTKIVRLKSLF